MTQIDKLDKDLEEAKATGEDSMAADATTPAGGSNTKRKADKSVAADKPHKQGSSDEKTPMGPNDTGMKEGIEVLFDGEDLSEDFRQKTTALFEAAVFERVESHKKELEEKFENDLEEQAGIITNELVEKVDSYLDYVVSEWLEDNKVQIESNFKVEVAESLFNGIVNVMSEHNLNVDEDVKDVVAEAEQAKAEMTEKYNEAVAKLIEANAIIEEGKKAAAFEEISEGLADTQVERLRALAEGVSFNDIEDYSKKLNIIKESYFQQEQVKSEDLSDQLLEESNEETEEVKPKLDGEMASYVNALARTLN